MISHTNRCIYIHIPKVAGTSVTEALKDPNYNYKECEKVIPFTKDSFTFNPPPSHLRAVDYLNYDCLTKEQFNSYYKFFLSETLGQELFQNINIEIML